MSRYIDKKKGEERRKKAYNYLLDRGLEPHHAAAVVGNLMQESYKHLDSTIENEIGAVGIAQWLGPRREALEQFAKNKGTSYKDFDTQLEFLYHEISSTGNSWGSKAQREFFESKTAEEAAAIFVRKFERSGEKPGDKGYENRIRNAKSIYLQYNDPTIYAKNEKGQIVNVNPETATEQQKLLSPKIKAEFYEKNFDIIDKKFSKENYKEPEEETKAKEEITNKAHTKEQEQEFIKKLQNLTTNLGSSNVPTEDASEGGVPTEDPYSMSNIIPEGNEFYNFFLPPDN